MLSPRYRSKYYTSAGWFRTNDRLYSPTNKRAVSSSQAIFPEQEKLLQSSFSAPLRHFFARKGAEAVVDTFGQLAPLVETVLEHLFVFRMKESYFEPNFHS